MKEADQEMSPFSFRPLKQEEGQRQIKRIQMKMSSRKGVEFLRGNGDYPWLCRFISTAPSLI
jgi:hypothetical protein